MDMNISTTIASEDHVVESAVAKPVVLATANVWKVPCLKASQKP